MSEAVKLVTVKILDKGMARCYVDGITTLPADKAEEEVALGRVAYIEDINRGEQKPATKTTPQRDGYLSRHGFNRGYTRVAWVQDNSKRGGAELSNECVVAAGEKCGFSVVGVTPQNFREDVLRSAEFIVVNNFFEFNNEQFGMIQKAIHEWRIPYVKYEHDTREIRRENVSRALFGWSSLNVFISPTHLSAHQHITNGRDIALPLAIDPDKYPAAEMTDERRNTVFIPTARKAGAGTYDWAHAHADKRYLICGQLSKPLQVSSSEGTPNAKAEDMAAVYARAGTVVHLPDQLWAGERVVLEAKLCGCEVVVNSNVGHASWPWFSTDTREQLADRLSRAPYTFWRECERAVCQNTAQ